MKKDLRPLVRVIWCEVACVAIIMTGDIGIPLAAAMLVLVPVVGLAREDAPWRRFAQKFSSVVALLYLPYFFLDWLYVSERLIFATVHLTFYLTLHTLLQRETPRERLRLHVLCLFEMLAAASMTVSFAFIFVFALFVATGALLLVCEQLDLTFIDRRRLGRAARAAGAVSALMLSFGVGVFFLLPRPSEGGFRLGGLTGITETGFSDEVRLGDFEEIRRSTDIVMRIVSEGGASAPRWRGPAYDRYEEGEWKQSYRGIMSLRRERGALVLSPPSSAPVTRTEVFVEPLDTDVLFLPPASARLEPNERYVFADPYWTLRTGRRGRAGRRYAVTWRHGEPPGTMPVKPLNGVLRLTARSRELYTQVPELSDAFHDLSASLIADERLETPLAAARDVEAYLKRSYGYSLTQPDRAYDDPIEDFLFETRAGHCEYFATAMALLLRDRGIPARLVTGFSRGEQNALGEFEVIRRTNAHAWVEVFDEDQGWMAFDPTPAASLGDAVVVTSLFSQGIDSIRMLWDVYVVAYDFERQRGLLGAIGDGLWALVERALPTVLLVVGVLLLLRLAALVLRRRFAIAWPFWLDPRWLLSFDFGRRRNRGALSSPRLRFYDGVLRRLERAGIPKPPGATAAEFARDLEDKLPGMVQLTEFYYRVRFGGEILSAVEAKRAERLAVAVRLAVAGDRPGGRA